MQSKDKLYRGNDPEEVGYETEPGGIFSLHKQQVNFSIVPSRSAPCPCEARTNLEVHKRMCEADAGG